LSFSFEKKARGIGAVPIPWNSGLLDGDGNVHRFLQAVPVYLPQIRFSSDWSTLLLFLCGLLQYNNHIVFYMLY